MRIHEVISERSPDMPMTQEPSVKKGKLRSVLEPIANVYNKVADTPAGRVAGRVLGQAGRALGVATGAGPTLATWTTDLGPEVPSAGPQRGNEINTNTGRPWTPAELEQYNRIYGTD